MKILWVKSDFLHPTTKGGHIRTLEMLKRLHRRHQIHYVAFNLAEQAGGVERSTEYATRAYPIAHNVPGRFTPRFWTQAAMSLVSPLPLAVSRYKSHAMRREIEQLTAREKFDAVVCDFLFPAANFPELSRIVLFQHNVEATIMKRHAKHGHTALHRAYFLGQYEKMQQFESAVCRAVKRVIAVSENDADTMRTEYRAPRVAWVPTGVDLDNFRPPEGVLPDTDLVFVGSMDWMPNIDGMHWFISELLPLIRAKRPGCTLAIVGRRPPSELYKIAAADARIRITGTVPDVRPHLWNARVSIVPLRIGSGTRLKIYESMAAKVPVVSTTVGAEGLDVEDGQDIAIADSPGQFADRCLELLEDADARRRLSAAAWQKVAACYSWDVVSQKFEQLLV